MFKDITNFAKSGNGKWILLIIVVFFILWAIMSYSNSKMMKKDSMDTGNSASSMPNNASPSSTMTAPTTTAPASAAVQGGSGYALQPVAQPSDLLPQDQNSQWAALNPVNAGNAAMPDLLQAGYHIGLDTIGQTLKNANYQLRSDPIIAKKDVGPWNQSTYDADYGRVPLEIGCASR
jgi:hypothetical protein